MRRILFSGAVALGCFLMLLPGGCGTEPTDPFRRRVPSMSVVSGDGQEGQVGTQLTSALVVRAVDSRGRPIRRLDIRWVVTSGGGHPAVDVNQTDQNGYMFNHWTLGTVAGEPQALEVRVVNTNELLGAFTARAYAGPAATMALSAGDTQTAVHGTAVPVAPAVRVADQYGNPVILITVTFTATSGGGSVSGATPSTDANGIAAVGGWMLGPTLGTNTLVATASGLSGSPVTFTATATVGAVSAGRSTVSANPTAIHTSTGATTSMIRVTARDAGGVPISGATVVLASSGTGTVLTQPAGPTDADGAVNGAVSASATGVKTIAATINQTAISQTAAVTVTVEPPNAAQSAVSASPDTIVAGSTFSTITVTAKNANAEPVVGATVVLVGPGPGTTVIQPTSTTDENGVTTGSFGSFGTGPKSVSAAIAGVTLNPATVFVVAGPPASIEAKASHQVAPAGSAVPNPPVVFIPDRSGNPVPGIEVEFAVTGGGGTISGGPIVATDSTGRAALSGWTLGSTGGLNTVTATASGSGITGNPVTFTATAEIGHWTRIAELPTRRFLLAAATLGDRVYAVGGVDFDAMATVEAYDPAAGAWIALAPMPTARYGLGVGVIDGVLYAVGGLGVGNTEVRAVEAYDPATDTWTTKAPLPTPRVGLAVVVVDGILYAIGGLGSGSQALGTVEAYDPGTDTWTTRASMPTPRYALGAATVNGMVYAVGGTGGEDVYGRAAVEAYDPATDTWSTRAALPAPTWGLAVAGGAGVLYAAGGYVWDGTSLNTTDNLGLYDPVTDTWKTGTAMPAPRTYIAATVLNGLMYVVGPENGSGGSAEVYHP